MRSSNNQATSFMRDDMNDIKEKITEFYNDKTTIHVSVQDGRKKFENIPSQITGIYNHFFTVIAHIKKYSDESFTINFIDVKIGKFKIAELELGEK